MVLISRIQPVRYMASANAGGDEYRNWSRRCPDGRGMVRRTRLPGLDMSWLSSCVDVTFQATATRDLRPERLLSHVRDAPHEKPPAMVLSSALPARHSA